MGRALVLPDVHAFVVDDPILVNEIVSSRKYFAVLMGGCGLY